MSEERVWPGGLERWGGQSYRNQRIHQNPLTLGHRRYRRPWFPVHSKDQSKLLSTSILPTHHEQNAWSLELHDSYSSVTFPDSIMTPIEPSSLASLNARISSFTVNGLNAFLLSGRFIVICNRNCDQSIVKCKNNALDASTILVNKEARSWQFHRPQFD